MQRYTRLINTIVLLLTNLETPYNLKKIVVFCVLSSFAIIWKSKRESWLLCFYCLMDVLLLYMFCDSSSRCRGLVCGV